MVSVDVEIPRNIYQALKLIGEISQVSVEELLRWGARGQAEAFTHGSWELYLEPTIAKVEELLKDP